MSYDCIDSRVEAGDNVTSLVLLRGKKAEQKSQRAQLTPKETKVRNELASFLAEPIILPPISTGNAASSDQTVIESCFSLQWWSQHRSNYGNSHHWCRGLDAFWNTCYFGAQRAAFLNSGLGSK